MYGNMSVFTPLKYYYCYDIGIYYFSHHLDSDASSLTTNKEQTNDAPYTMISRLLKEQDMDDLLQVFQEHNIQVIIF